MSSARVGVVVVGIAFVILSCSRATEPEELSLLPVEARSGGLTTAFDETDQAFKLTARNINSTELQFFADGKVVFESDWVAETGVPFGGLGPDFDAVACVSCHILNGRAAAPADDGLVPVGFTVRLTVADAATTDRLGVQLTAQSVGSVGEASVTVTYQEFPGEYADGEPFSLRHPTYRVETSDGIALPDDAVVGVRQAPPLPGLGLLELIGLSDMEALADPDDLDDDGISGRLAVAIDLVEGATAAGRFGWNATQPSVLQQTATALFNDMGITSRIFPPTGCKLGEICDQSAAEIPDEFLFWLATYTQLLAVPAARDVADIEVQRGHALFVESGCSACHGGPYTTQQGPIEGLSNQVIFPYTDLLVHDMGDDLADRTVGGEVVITEWRTPPLWGIGLIETVNGHTDFLHDGRARDVAEAILWHGGEGESAAETFGSMDATDRAALIRFIESL